MAKQRTSTLAESEQLTEFVKFLAAPHPMSAEVAQHIQPMTMSRTNTISKSNAAIGERCAVFKALEQLQPILQVFLDDNSSARAMTAGVIEYARNQHVVEDVEDAEAMDSNGSENRDGDNNHLLNVTPIQLDRQEVEEGNSSPSAFSPDPFYRFEVVAHSSEPDTDTLMPEPTDGCPCSPPQQESNSPPSHSTPSDSDDLPGELNDPTDDIPTEPDATSQPGKRPKRKSLPPSETPSKKPKPTPDHYRFDIIRCWKDAPPEIQTRIEERFERMDPQKKTCMMVWISIQSKGMLFFWIPENNAT